MLLDTVRGSFMLADDAEVTAEANPDDLHADKLASLLEAGVNRLSIGVQSLDDGLLRVLGRRHSAREALDAFRAARGAGFDNVSIDLMYGLPDQTPEQWGATLDSALDLRPSHISMYCLTLEGGTPMERDAAAGRIPVPDSDLAADMYLAAEVRTARRASGTTRSRTGRYRAGRAAITWSTGGTGRSWAWARRALVPGRAPLPQHQVAEGVYPQDGARGAAPSRGREALRVRPCRRSRGACRPPAGDGRDDDDGAAARYGCRRSPVRGALRGAAGRSRTAKSSTSFRTTGCWRRGAIGSSSHPGGGSWATRCSAASSRAGGREHQRTAEDSARRWLQTVDLG